MIQALPKRRSRNGLAHTLLMATTPFGRGGSAECGARGWSICNRSRPDAREGRYSSDSDSAECRDTLDHNGALMLVYSGV